jgi:hypothetical protein
MKAKYSFLAVIAVCTGLVLPAGCGPQTPVEGPKTAGIEPKKVPVSRPPSGPDKTRRKLTPVVARKIEPQPQEGNPKITFENVLHDFGRIGPTTKSVCEFDFTNTGDAPLEIGRIRTCCGVHANLKTGRKRYAPQETGTVIVTFSPARFRGSIRKHLTVPSNDSSNPKTKLTIKANVAMQVRYEPKKLELSLREENAGCPQIKLTSTDGRSFAVKSFSSTNSCITADFDSSLRATKITLEPRVDTAKLRSGSKGQVRIGLTHPNCRRVSIAFAVPPRFSAEPAAIMISDLKLQKPVRRELWIFSNYGEDFEIESTSSKKGTIEVLNQQKLGKRYKLELQITAPASEGNIRVLSDAFVVNLKGGERVVISCRGTYSRQ